VGGRRWTLLAVLTLAAIGGAVWWLRPGPCERLVAYRLDRVDEGFGLDRETVLDALREAEALWQRAAGRPVFVHSPTASLTVRLVYDERQQTTQASARARASLERSRASHARVGAAFADARERYETRLREHREARQAYEEQARGYSAQVRDWNARGGAPPGVRAELDAERARFEARRRELEEERERLAELAGEARELAARGNVIAREHNRAAATFNERYGAPRRFHKGEFDGRTITVYEFHDERDLALLLAHELGHALGLGHVDEPAAVMHAMAGGQPVEPLALAAADAAALRARCGW
jgi:hypothetical protein